MAGMISRVELIVNGFHHGRKNQIITNFGIIEVDSITVDTVGTILGMTQMIYNFPTSSITTTLHGTVH